MTMPYQKYTKIQITNIYLPEQKSTTSSFQISIHPFVTYASVFHTGYNDMSVILRNQVIPS